MKASPYGPVYTPLLVVSGIFALGALLTLIPYPSASWPNVMGYRSLCTFAPGATFACALLAAITCILRARLVRRNPTPVLIPIVAIALLGIGLAVSITAWAGVKATYSPDSDATTGASVPE